jgi:CO dehydrogenase maturation factor
MLRFTETELTLGKQRITKMKISLCGKGGSGKSTVASLLAGAAQARGFKTLVIDSDESNSGLFRMLGFENPPIPLMELVGGKQSLKKKMSQSDVLTEAVIGINHIPPQHICKKDGLMLVSIGKILQALEGCACPMGVLSREFLRKLRLAENEIAIVDMEAGVEHFGRGLDAGIDNVVLVVEPSYESLALSEKIKGLAGEMQKNLWAVLNKISSDSLASKLEDELKKREIETIGIIPYDSIVFTACLEGNPISQGQSTQQAGKILDLLLTKPTKKFKG